MPRYGVQAAAIGGAGIAAEKKLAGRLGARLTAGSGSGQRSATGDFHVSTGPVAFKVVAKSTLNASFSLKLDWLMKINNEAVMSGKEPALAFQFVKGDGDALPFGSWVAIPERVFKQVFCGEE